MKHLLTGLILLTWGCTAQAQTWETGLAINKTHLQKLDIVNASLVKINAQLGDVVNQYNAMATQYPALRLPVLR